MVRVVMVERDGGIAGEKPAGGLGLDFDKCQHIPKILVTLRMLCNAESAKRILNTLKAPYFEETAKPTVQAFRFAMMLLQGYHVGEGRSRTGSTEYPTLRR